MGNAADVSSDAIQSQQQCSYGLEHDAESSHTDHIRLLTRDDNRTSHSEMTSTGALSLFEPASTFRFLDLSLLSFHKAQQRYIVVTNHGGVVASHTSKPFTVTQ